MPEDDDTRPLTRRERLRRQTVDEIVEAALGLVDDGGAHGLSLASVGKAVGMTPPALYHYFASREALLDALVLAGYADLGTAVETAVRQAQDRSPADRLAAITGAWRRWALDHPRRYSMLFTGSRREAVDPLESVGAISQSMLALVTTIQEVAAGTETGAAVSADAVDAVETADAGDAGHPGHPGDTGDTGDTGEGSVLDQDLARWGRSLTTPAEAAPAVLRLALSTWYRVHGLVSLEIVGAFGTMGLDGERLLAAELEGLVREAARVLPRSGAGRPANPAAR